MNPCTCRDALGTPMGEFIRSIRDCPIHGHPQDRTIRCGVCQAPMGTPHARFCIQGKREEPTIRDTADFEGMPAAALSILKGQPVGSEATINGLPVWRWEESSPLTRILADARPEGSVELPEEWMVRANLGGRESALRAALRRWPGREWSREDVPFAWRVRLSWRPARAHAYAEGEEKPVQNAPSLSLMKPIQP